MKFIVVFLCLLVTVFASNFSNTLSKEAQKSHKMILIEATSAYCGYCIKMKKEVLSDKEVKELIEKKYIFKEIMVDSQKLPFGLEKEFGGMTPTFFIIDSNGKLLKKIPGSWNKSDFLDFIGK